MRTKLPRSPSILATALVICALVFPARAAVANHGAAGDPMSTVPRLLPPGVVFGTVADHDDQTKSNGHTSGHPECGSTTGAATYVFTAPAGTRLQVSLTDDLGGQSLCAVELFRLHNPSDTLTSFYEDPDRSLFRVGTLDLCALTASTCTLERTLTAGDTHYVVFWPSGDGSPDAAEFSFTAAILRPTATALSISRQYADSGGCAKVRIGRSFVGTGTVSPGGTGSMVFRLQRLEGSSWQPFSTYPRAISSNRASLLIYLRPFGRYRLRAEFPGDLASLASASPWACVDVVAVSSASIVISRHYGMIADYHKVRRGASFNTTATIAPAPARGRIRFRLERETSSGGHSFIYSYLRTVTDSRSILTTSIGGHPGYYRIRAEYVGDTLHTTAISFFICVQIT